ncbi:hypothetical protein Q9966_010727 [Columba livia]|nr:hypothetical protein Q9966_010727 [Columba livia]
MSGSPAAAWARGRRMRRGRPRLFGRTRAAGAPFLPVPCSRHGAREEARSQRWQKKEAGVEVHPGLHPPRGGRDHGRRQLRAVPAGTDQGERQSGKPGRGRGDHREEQEQDHRHVGGPILKEVPEVPDQEVPEEEQPAGLAARGGQQQGELRAALLPDQPGRGGGGGGGLNPPRPFCTVLLS